MVIVKEDDNETMACVEVCAGVLEYDVTIFVLFNNGTAVSKSDPATQFLVAYTKGTTSEIKELVVQQCTIKLEICVT